MEGNSQTHARPTYRLLTQEQIDTLHHATLEVLETVGIRVDHPEAVEMLRSSGCKVIDEKIILFPTKLVEACIQSAPSSIMIYNRMGDTAMNLTGRNVYFGLGTDLVKTIDPITGQLRSSVLQDVINASIVVDACKEIDFNASFALPGDVQTNAM